MARGEIDRGVLPDPPGRPRQTADVEAVEADELAGVVDRDVALRRRHQRLRSRRTGVAGDQAEPGEAPVEAVAAEDPPHAVGADHDAAPALLGEGCRDPPRAEPRVAQAE